MSLLEDTLAMSTPRDRDDATRPPSDDTTSPVNSHGARNVDGEREPACPFCASPDVELLSPFASQLSTSQYVCRTCHTPFERFTRDAEA
jgi:hypothetical protein